MTNTLMNLSHVQQGWLAVMAEEANDEHARAVGSIDDALYHMKKSGDALAKVKGELAKPGHGTFLKWIDVNFVGSRDTAYRYMVVASHYEEFRERLSFAANGGRQKRLGYQNLVREIVARETPQRRALREAEERAEQEEIDEFLGTEPNPEPEQLEPTVERPIPFVDVLAPGEPLIAEASELFQPTVTVAEVAERQQAAIERDEVYLLLTVLEGLAKLRTLEQADVIDALLAYEHRDSCLADMESLDGWLRDVLKATHARLKKKLTVVE